MLRIVWERKLERSRKNRVGKLAHDLLRDRCPRAAPNPICDIICSMCWVQWCIGATEKGTRVVVRGGGIALSPMALSPLFSVWRGFGRVGWNSKSTIHSAEEAAQMRRQNDHRCRHHLKADPESDQE
jgi:hypothetical protein